MLRKRVGRVRRSLGHLDDASRELIRLKFNENLSYEEISTRTGLGIGHVAQRLHNVLKSLAADLEGAGRIP
jgi:RNA polymerase sigma-70 factor (ECF subfamily)